MTKEDKDLLIDYLRCNISDERLLADYSVDIRSDKQHVIAELEESIETNDTDRLDLALTLLDLSGLSLQFIDVLNKLLISPWHYRHQEITRHIQTLKSPSSIVFIEKVLESDFMFLEYTASESGAIAKWFSWALSGIGTKEAIDVMKKYAQSADDGIGNKMQYRLQKLTSKTTSS